MLNIISLGAGVQSSRIALGAAFGEITPMPDAAIFAHVGDGAEPQRVYDWLNELEKHLPFPVYRVSAGDLIRDSLTKKTHSDGTEYANNLIPAYVGGAGLLGRKCTADYKVRPIRRKIKSLLGFGRYDRWPKKLSVIQWLGISLDEIQRMKTSVEPWMEFRHPLIEMRETRADCEAWLSKHGFHDVPRSSCIFCPFHSNDEWRRLSTEEFQFAVRFEKDLQAALNGRLKGLPFLHASRVPLSDVDFSTAEDNGQMNWLDECAGMCGV